LFERHMKTVLLPAATTQVCGGKLMIGAAFTHQLRRVLPLPIVIQFVGAVADALHTLELALTKLRVHCTVWVVGCVALRFKMRVSTFVAVVTARVVLTVVVTTFVLAGVTPSNRGRGSVLS
jgi:ATP-dependent protease HslVU (ClpYQ) peptidase subunit